MRVTADNQLLEQNAGTTLGILPRPDGNISSQSSKNVVHVVGFSADNLVVVQQDYTDNFMLMSVHLPCES